jgi:phage terminase small subunit
MAEITTFHRQAAAPPIPKGLQGKARAYWVKVCRDFELDPFHYDTLEQACWSLQRAEEARLIVNEVGQFYENPKTGALLRHPAVATEEKNRALFVRFVRELGLDLASEQARPPSRTGRRSR